MSDPRLRSRAHTALRSLVSLGFLVASLRVVVLAAPNPVRPYKLPPNLLEYFKSRYDLPDDMIVSTLRETPDGPLGHINVHGKLTIASPMGATREERARSATRAFLQHEAAFLDIADFSEIRELSIKFNDSERYEWLRGECDVQYERALGGIALYGTLYRFHVDPKGFITTFQATLVPVSSDLYAAVMRDKIARDEAGAIVEHDLESLDLRKTAVAVGEPTLAAYWRAPHVL